MNRSGIQGVTARADRGVDAGIEEVGRERDDFPAEQRIHLRTTNHIESTFSTVRLRTNVTRGAGSPAAALAMVFKLVESAQARRRVITAPHLENGHLVEQPRSAAHR